MGDSDRTPSVGRHQGGGYWCAACGDIKQPCPHWEPIRAFLSAASSPVVSETGAQPLKTFSSTAYPRSDGNEIIIHHSGPLAGILGNLLDKIKAWQAASVLTEEQPECCPDYIAAWNQHSINCPKASHPQDERERFFQLSFEMWEQSRGGFFDERLKAWPSAKFHEWCDLGARIRK